MTQKLKKNDGGKVVLDGVEVNSVLAAQPDFLVPLVQEAVQTILEVEMAECLQAGKHERNEARLGYRSGYYRRRLITRVPS
jgi:putative transposase